LVHGHIKFDISIGGEFFTWVYALNQLFTTFSDKELDFLRADTLYYTSVRE